MAKNAKLTRSPEPAEDDLRSARPPLVRRLDISALHQPQGPNSGINAIIGKWPGDDDLSEEEFIALVEEIS